MPNQESVRELIRKEIVGFSDKIHVKGQTYEQYRKVLDTIVDKILSLTKPEDCVCAKIHHLETQIFLLKKELAEEKAKKCDIKFGKPEGQSITRGERTDMIKKLKVNDYAVNSRDIVKKINEIIDHLSQEKDICDTCIEVCKSTSPRESCSLYKPKGQDKAELDEIALRNLICKGCGEECNIQETGECEICKDTAKLITAHFKPSVVSVEEITDLIGRMTRDGYGIQAIGTSVHNLIEKEKDKVELDEKEVALVIYNTCVNELNKTIGFTLLQEECRLFAKAIVAHFKPSVPSKEELAIISHLKGG